LNKRRLAAREREKMSGRRLEKRQLIELAKVDRARACRRRRFNRYRNELVGALGYCTWSPFRLCLVAFTRKAAALSTYNVRGHILLTAARSQGSVSVSRGSYICSMVCRMRTAVRWLDSPNNELTCSLVFPARRCRRQ
jgi:hypothetical protein